MKRAFEKWFETSELCEWALQLYWRKPILKAAFKAGWEAKTSSLLASKKIKEKKE